MLVCGGEGPGRAVLSVTSEVASRPLRRNLVIQPARARPPLQESEIEIFGYFDAPGQERPVFDPGLDVPCPFCTEHLSKPMMTISVMSAAGNKCFFYRAHKWCYKWADPEEISYIESLKIDGGG